MDTKTGETKTWCNLNCYPSEPIFVPRPNAKVRRRISKLIHLTSNMTLQSIYILVLNITICKRLALIRSLLLDCDSSSSLRVDTSILSEQNVASFSISFLLLNARCRWLVTTGRIESRDILQFILFSSISIWKVFQFDGPLTTIQFAIICITSY